MKKSTWKNIVLYVSLASFLALMVWSAFMAFMPTVKADSIGVTHSYNPETKTYTIYRWFGAEKVVNLTLVDNTAQCLTDCEATIKIVPYINFNTNNIPNDYKWRYLNSKGQEENIKGLSVYYFASISEDKSYTCNTEYFNYTLNPKHAHCWQKTSYYDGNTSTWKDKLVKIFDRDFETGDLPTKTVYWTESRNEWKIIDYHNQNLLQGHEYLIKIKGQKDMKKILDWRNTFYSVGLDEWAWWDASWQYKKCINVTNNDVSMNNATLNYTLQVKALVDAGKMQSDYDDLRVIDDDNSSEMFYNWTIFNSTHLEVFWQARNNFTGLRNFCFYYGNPSAANGADSWRDVYIEYDTFTNGNIDTNMWALTGTQIKESTEGLNVWNGDESWTDDFIVSAGDFENFSYPVKIEFQVRPVAWGGNYNVWLWGDGTLAAASNAVRWYTSDDTTNLFVATDAVPGIHPLIAANWHNETINITHLTNGVAFYRNGTINAGSTASDMDKFDLNRGIRWGSYGTYNMTYRNLKISRLFTINPITSALGPEQTAGGITAALMSPANNTFTTTALNNFTCNATGTGLTTVANLSFYLWNSTGVLDYHSHLDCADVSTCQKSWMYSLPYDDKFQWNCYAVSTGSGYNDWDINRTINYDSQSPIIKINLPKRYDVYNYSVRIPISLAVNDTNLDKCWYSSQGCDLSICIPPETVMMVNCSTDFINISDTYAYTVAFYANDTAGHESSSVVDITAINSTLGNSYNSPVTETSDQNFGHQIRKTNKAQLNVSSTYFYYNNTKYVGNVTALQGDSVIFGGEGGENITYNISITIPIVETDPTIKTFYWNFNFSFYNVTRSFISPTYSQTINQMVLDSTCNANTSEIMNFTYFEETNHTKQNGTTQATIWYWASNRSLNKTASFNFPYKTNFTICANGSYYTDGYFKSQSTGYTDRSYWLLNFSTNTSVLENIELFFLPTAKATSVIVKVLDEGYMPMSNHYVKVLRYYPENNVFRTVEIFKTDNQGYGLAHLVEEDVDYKFIVQDYDKSLKTTESMRILCIDTPCTLEIRVFNQESPYEDLLPTGLGYTLKWVNASSTVQLEWNDVTGRTKTMRLLVTAKGHTDSVACNTTVESSAGTIICDLTGRPDKTYLAQVYRGASPESWLTNLWIYLDTTFRSFGNEGVIVMIFVMMVLGLVGLWNPVVSLVLMVAGVLFMLVTGMAFIAPTIIGAIIVIVAITARMLKT